jgi:hypothetical protein
MQILTTTLTFDKTKDSFNTPVFQDFRTTRDIETTFDEISRKYKKARQLKVGFPFAVIIAISILIFMFLGMYGCGISILLNPSFYIQGEESLVELFKNDRVRTVAFSGETLTKVSYLQLFMKEQNKQMNFFTRELSNEEVVNAFKSSSVFMDLEKINNTQLFCEELKKSKIPFIGGYEKETSKNFLTKCRPIIDLVDYKEVSYFLPFAVICSIVVSNFFFYIFIILLIIKVASDRRLTAVEKEVEQISMEMFEPKGMKLRLNATLNPPTIELETIQQINYPPQDFSNQYQPETFSTGMYYNTTQF